MAICAARSGGEGFSNDESAFVSGDFSWTSLATSIGLLCANIDEDDGDEGVAGEDDAVDGDAGVAGEDDAVDGDEGVAGEDDVVDGDVVEIEATG